MRGLSMSRAWEEAKSVIARDGRLLVSVALALIVLPQAIMGVVGLPTEPEAAALSRLVYLAVVLIGLAAQISLNRLAIGPSVTVGGAIGRGFARLIPLVAAFVIFVFALVLVMMTIAVPLSAGGLVTLPGAGHPPPAWLLLLMIALLAIGFAIFQLSIPVAAAERGGPIHLFKRSWQLARGHYLQLLGFVALVIVGVVILGLATRSVFGSLVILALGKPVAGSMSALVLGLIAGIVQAAFTVVTAVMLARIYVQLVGRAETDSGVPISGI